MELEFSRNMHIYTFICTKYLQKFYKILCSDSTGGLADRLTDGQRNIIPLTTCRLALGINI